jgi:hypothetical protein
MRKIILLFLYLILFSFVNGNQIDIGIFKSGSVPKKIEIYMRPNFNISSIQTITGILYTVRWDDPSIVITTQSIYPFFIAPQGSPILYNGYYYQVFAAVPMIAMAMNANQAYLASSFTYTNGDCSKFQIIQDEWTQANNGNVYIELVGLEVTGIIYQANVFFASIGGNISNTMGDTTLLGNSTGVMSLTGYAGAITTWQRRVNEGPWENIPGTAGLETYSEIPQQTGDYYYQTIIQNGICPIATSGMFHTMVIAEIYLNLKLYLEGAFENNVMNTKLNESGLIPLTQPYNFLPWNYNGSESVVNIPVDAVDWVLIEIRETEGNVTTATSDKVVYRKAAFLMKNGTIRGMDGIQKPVAYLSLQKNVYIAVYHRNHLAIISAASPLIVDWNCYYDFSTGENQVYGGTLGHKEIADGIWAMRAGDANSNGIISMEDKVNFWNSRVGFKAYLTTDFSLDSQTDNKDKDKLWYHNLGFSSQVPE